jgi:hypothetical protein
MKKFNILVLAVFAVFAFGAVTATAAMAEETEETTRCIPAAKTEGLWEKEASLLACSTQLSTANSPFELVVFLLAEYLLGGLAVAATLSVETTGELLLEDKKATLGIKAMVLCSGILDGTIGANGVDEITELLSLAGAAISLTALSGTALLCSGQEGCTTGTENDEVWAVKLPWKTLLELVEEASPTAYTGFVVLILPGTAGPVGWYTKCATALGTSEDECLAVEGGSEATNITEGVGGSFSEAFTLLVDAPLANCSASSEKETGNVGTETPGVEKVVESSEVLSVSE